MYTLKIHIDEMRSRDYEDLYALWKGQKESCFSLLKLGEPTRPEDGKRFTAPGIINNVELEVKLSNNEMPAGLADRLASILLRRSTDGAV